MFRPTASCIWNSFRSSEKRHLILTGGTAEERSELLSKLFSEDLPQWNIPGEITLDYYRDIDKEEIHCACSIEHLETVSDDQFVVNLDAPYGNMGCVIMASGLGKRFGSNKLMADFSGRPMIARILDATEGVFSHRVVVTRYKDVAEYAESWGVQVILHQFPHRSDTVRLGLERMLDTENCIFCTGDQPILSRDTVASLALAAVNARRSIWRTSWAGNPGSPVVFPSWSYPELLDLPEGKGGMVVARKYPERIRYLEAASAEELMDADTPETLAYLRSFA